MKKDNWVHLIVFLVFCLFPAIVFASYPKNQYPYVPPTEKMQHNGEYSIYVLTNGKWQDAGKLTYDEFFRERTIVLSSYISAGKEQRIRIVQKGGQAAHIDSVLLGEMPPVEVVGITQGIRKLSKQDFDIIDAYGKTIEVVFNKNNRNETLKLTARVEDINRGIPFLFPLKNLCQKMDTNAQFYTYKLNSRKGSMTVDGRLNEVSYQLPFFKEYSLSVTGHPSTYTYGWVWNDDEYLYVAIDFSGDNTMDGDKDFAKVYINTGKDVKEFKVSVPETRWGKPGFTYTNKVKYQHKVYEFKIPLTEIDKEYAYKDEILLAFSAYGTNGTSQGGACCYGSGTYSCQVVTKSECLNTLHGYYYGIPSCTISACQPGNYTYEALIDSRPGGGDVEVVQKGELPHSVPGIDYKVVIEFNGSKGILALGPTHILEYQGSGPGFININTDSSTHNIGYGNGYNGSSVVEFRALKSLLGNPDSMRIIYHASRLTFFNDYTDPFPYPIGAAIPSLSQWGMIVLSLLLLISAVFILRKRKTGVAKLLSSLLIVISLAGFAWALTITLDGQVNDWGTLKPAILDTQGDSSADDDFEDIFAGYITSDDTYFYFRMDVNVWTGG
jgi:hypothetical protein